jgi:hypothetical protein
MSLLQVESDLPTFLGLLVCVMAFCGAAVQDAKKQEVYNLLWAPTFVGGVLFWLWSYSLGSIALLFAFNTILFIAYTTFLKIFTTTPTADIVSVGALYFAGGRWSFVGLIVALTMIMAYGRWKHRLNVPWVPFMFCGFVVSFVVVLVTS